MKKLLFLLSILITNLTIAQIPTDGLKGYWPFNNNANDVSGNGNNGTVNGATLAIDRNGIANSAYSFDGIDDYITIINENNFDFGTSDFAISVWIKTSDVSIDGQYRRIIDKGLVSGFAVYVRSDNKIGVDVYKTTTGFYSSEIANNSWHHIVLNFDRDNMVKVYFDNSLIGQSSISVENRALSNAYSLIIGSRSQNLTQGRWKGQIDDLRIYNRLLTDLEIGELYIENQLPPSNTWIVNGINSYFDGRGNLGIGTKNPQSRLAVNGKLTAKEVEVTLSGWSDFVFDKNYSLITLEDLEKYIYENRHLPDVASEKEVLENGLNLGQNNAVLLQKIEELTLYLIEQNKTLKAQNDKISDMEVEIKELKKK
jgi:hypothetical protein